MSAMRRAEHFCERFGLKAPILLAPMAGVSAPALSAAVANAGGLGACGVVLMAAEEIIAWAEAVRTRSSGAFQLNNWIPDPAPCRDQEHETQVREFLAGWGPEVAPETGDATPPDFEAQCEAMLSAAPPIISSIMGLYPPTFVDKLKSRGIAWFATVSTVAEARAAEEAGADVIVAQGAEAGGHRGSFNAADAERGQVGTFALAPAIVDAVKAPVVASGGVADARGMAAGLARAPARCRSAPAFCDAPKLVFIPLGRTPSSEPLPKTPWSAASLAGAPLAA